MTTALLERLVVSFDGNDRKPVSGEDLGDASTHGAQAHDADGRKFAGHAGSLAWNVQNSRTVGSSRPRSAS